MAGGPYRVICDFCGLKKWASECRMTWDNFFVCADTCWQPRHPQDFVRARNDNTSVPIARPDVPQTQGGTTVKTTALKHATTIDLASITDIASGDSIGITLDDGIVHWTHSNGTPAGSTVTLPDGDPLPAPATAGNAVILPSINNENWATT